LSTPRGPKGLIWERERKMIVTQEKMNFCGLEDYDHLLPSQERVALGNSEMPCYHFLKLFKYAEKMTEL
jgi:hypothetical protein